MKFSTLLILTFIGLILLGIFWDRSPQTRLSGGRPTGLPTTGAPTFSAPFSSPTSSPAAGSGASYPATSSSPGVISSVIEFVKRKLTGGDRRTNWRRDDLRIVRGTVVERLDNGLVLDCSGWVVKSAVNPGVYAGDGEGMTTIYANLVDADELVRFGRLMTVENGSLRPSLYERSLWVPVKYLIGPVLLEGYPDAPGIVGKNIKVVAAPDGTSDWHAQAIPAFTASFTLTGEAPAPAGSWMWQQGGSPLDRK